MDQDGNKTMHRFPVQALQVQESADDELDKDEARQTRGMFSAVW